MLINLHQIIESNKDKINSDPELLKAILPVKADPVEIYNTNFDIEQIKDVDIEDIQSDIIRIKLTALDMLKDTN